MTAPRSPHRYAGRFRYDLLLEIMTGILKRGNRRHFYIRNIARIMETDGRTYHQYMPHLLRCGAVKVVEQRNKCRPDGFARRNLYIRNFEAEEVPFYMNMMKELSIMEGIPLRGWQHYVD